MVRHSLSLLVLTLSDDVAPTVVGYTLKELARVASAKLQPSYPLLVPLAFLACHEPDEELKALFEEVWSELGASLLTHTETIVGVLVTALNHASYARKKQGAKVPPTPSHPSSFFH